MSTTAEKTSTEKPVKKPSTRLAQKMLPDVDPNSALLPPDKWVLKTVYDTFKTHQGIRRTVLKMAGLTAFGLAAIGAGIVGAVLAPAALPAAGFVAAGLGVSVISGLVAKKEGEKLKTKYMPDIAEIVKNKYLELKMNELKKAWQDNARKKKQEREAAKAAAAQKAEAEKLAREKAAEAEAKQAAEKPATPEVKEPVKAEAKPAKTKVEKPKAPEEEPKGFAKRFLRGALKKAQDFGAEVQEEIKKQQAEKEARNDNKPQGNSDKKSAPPQP